MGKTTLYHPVSLHVIRGAAEYGGFKFGKISQKYANFKKKTAIYHAVIAELPAHMKQPSPYFIQHALNQQFLDDVRVNYVSFHRGSWSCEIKVSLDPEPEQSAFEDDTYTIENTVPSTESGL